MSMKGFTLRPHQEGLDRNFREFQGLGVKNILNTLATGGGKTPLMVFMAKRELDQGKRVALMVHRRELVGQISLTLGSFGLTHSAVLADDGWAELARLHQRTFGMSMLGSAEPIVVASVDTVVARGLVGQWHTIFIDEAHHVLADNKWGKACAGAKEVIGFTATAQRADGKGLGVSGSGLFEACNVGPCGDDLIEDGWLSPYEVYRVPTDVDRRELKVGATGDFTQKSLSAATHKSRVLNARVVESYLEYAKGEPFIGFATDREHSRTLEERFRAAGVRAVHLDATSSATERFNAIEAFRAGNIDGLLNVDLFREGFDVPACKVLLDARATQSYVGFAQGAGRVLRPVFGAGLPLDTPEQRKAAMVGGPAKILDLVGNFSEASGLGSPTERKVPQMSNRETRSRTKTVSPFREIMCRNLGCLRMRPVIDKVCPHCGQPQPKDAPQDVAEMDGKLEKMAVISLGQALGDPRIPQNLPPHVRMAIAKRHGEKKKALIELLPLMATHTLLAKMLGEPEDVYFIKKIKRHPLEIYGLTTGELRGIMEALKLGTTEGGSNA